MILFPQVLLDEHPAPPGTSSVWVSSNRVTVTGHQPAAVPASQYPWVPPHGSVPPPYGCMQYHGPPPTVVFTHGTINIVDLY